MSRNDISKTHKAIEELEQLNLLKISASMVNNELTPGERRYGSRLITAHAKVRPVIRSSLSNMRLNPTAMPAI
jgi:hypothetical protein